MAVTGGSGNPEREDVPDDVIKRTLPFMSLVIATMVQIQWLTGMRPSELCRMTFGSIYRTDDLWYYDLEFHKTQEYIGKKTIPLGKPEQKLLLPFLENKKGTDALFSPRMTKKNEFYTSQSYRTAVERAIQKGNKVLPDNEKIPHWTPYQLRHATATVIELEDGLDAAQAQLGHKTANMTKRYSKAQLKTREKLARNRKNPFDESNS